jgi:hypothetical protein
MLISGLASEELWKFAAVGFLVLGFLMKLIGMDFEAFMTI